MTKKKITVLQLYRQHKKIKDLEDKIYLEKRKLQDMVQESPSYSEMLNVDGNVYRVETRKRGYWDGPLVVSRIASADELAKVVS